jgi:hypothetical protein
MIVLYSNVVKMFIVDDTSTYQYCTSILSATRFHTINQASNYILDNNIEHNGLYFLEILTT